MRETILNLKERADLRSSEIPTLAGMAVTVISAIVTREIVGTEALTLFGFIFMATSAARDVGARVVDGVANKIVKRKERRETTNVIQDAAQRVRALH